MSETEVTRMKPLDRLLSLFVSPTALMKNIKAFPAVLIPLLTVTLLAIAMLPFMFSYTQIQTRQLSRVSLERYGVDYFNLTPVDADENVTQTVSTITTVTTVLTTVLTYPISAFFSALGLFVICKIARARGGKLIHYYSMVMHMYIIGALGAVISTALCVALDSTLNVTSLAAVFMPLGDVTQPAYNVLSCISVFNIWTTVLSILGIKAITECSTVKAVAIGLIGYILAVAFTSTTMSMTFLTYDLLNNMSI